MEQFGFVLPKWGRCCPSNPKKLENNPMQSSRDRTAALTALDPRFTPVRAVTPLRGAILAFSVVGACGVARLDRLRFRQ